MLAYASGFRPEKTKLHWWESEKSAAVLHHGPLIVGFSEKNKSIVLIYLGGHGDVVGAWSFSLDDSDIKMKLSKK